MAEPRIQYAKTSDGVSIAYWTLGEGMPLVHMPLIPISHIQAEWRSPGWHGWYERLSGDRMLVRYDGRGSGLSDRNVADYSLDALVGDLEAVVDRLGLERFALMGLHRSGPMAITYAVRHPERVSHLLLWCAWAGGAPYMNSPRLQAFRAMLEGDWEMFVETVAQQAAGLVDEIPMRSITALIRQCATQKAYMAVFDATAGHDAYPMLARVQSPTLVLHPAHNALVTVDMARELATRIPKARLAILESAAIWPFMGDMETLAAAIDEFLSEGEEPAGPELPQGTAIILFADIADSTALTERMGDAAFRGKARELDGALRAAIRECEGVPVEGKLLGDGVLAVFTSARQAIEAALACGRAGDDAGLPLHLGVHAGDVIREENPDGRGNVYGGAVNIAARISAASAPGEVLVSDTVRGLARTSAGVRFEDRGEHELKGVSEPVRVWAVRSFDSPSAAAPGGSG